MQTTLITLPSGAEASIVTYSRPGWQSALAARTALTGGAGSVENLRHTMADLATAMDRAKERRQ